MKKKPLSIDDLLAALRNPEEIAEDQKADLPKLANSRETWARIGSGDSSLATDVGILPNELNDFLKEWIEDNPYNAIG